MEDSEVPLYDTLQPIIDEAITIATANVLLRLDHRPKKARERRKQRRKRR